MVLLSLRSDVFLKNLLAITPIEGKEKFGAKIQSFDVIEAHMLSRDSSAHWLLELTARVRSLKTNPS